MAAVQSLGYAPNALARSLTMQRSRLIATVMADLRNPFYADLLGRISESLQRRGLSLLLLSIGDARRLDETLPGLLAYRPDGVLVTSATLSSGMAAHCSSLGIPVVQLNRLATAGTASAVTCDNPGGGAAVAELLLRGGHQRIAFMAGLEDTSTSQEREAGFTGALRRAGACLAARDTGHYSREGAVGAARRMLGAALRPDALFCANDVMALATLDVARREFGLDVPGDLAVVGFDNIEMASWSGHGLTSVDQNAAQMVERAIDQLQGCGTANDRPAVERVACQVVVRATTRNTG